MLSKANTSLLGPDFLSRLNLQDPHDLRPVSGGDVNLAYSLYSGNDRYFLKVQPYQDRHFFDSEVASLKALQKHVTVPKVMKQGEIQGFAYLLLSWVKSGPSNQGDLGRALAVLHQTKGSQFGFNLSNDYDFVPKDNTWSDSWGEFFVHQRLEPLMKQAIKKGFWLSQRGDHFEHLKQAILSDAHVQNVKPSLLHGDLWAGNFMFDEKGQPVFIDPNAFYGDREYDLAVSAVFPGFSQDFYEAYQKAYPLDEGYQERFKWYEFYYILMHFVRFGDIYAPRLNRLLLQF
ncbi:fructosamine kinase family protein [Fructobacillus sp. M1-13]|uniref:Fructosamine kinase family protein n=1 Tax=Fructobacillus papyriferae TaxID=2713171 RepID=A0ABS5QPY1_9LACO|nr:fructosamine kinase family protein [Fructobacillus papyriferae]MBS9334535.1 fructosamine kinase family protein [Fructobacillus papyriferae]MCD2158524.1 fructosamine kinase family protein [Fructobacillus papyriferae]